MLPFYVAFLLCFIYCYVLFMEPFITEVCFRVCGCWEPPNHVESFYISNRPHCFTRLITFRPRRSSPRCPPSPQLVSSNPAVVIAENSRILPGTFARPSVTDERLTLAYARSSDFHVCRRDFAPEGCKRDSSGQRQRHLKDYREEKTKRNLPAM